MSADAYWSGDYAGLVGGHWRFYYGYEAVDDDDNWLFTAEFKGERVMTATAEQLGVDPRENVGAILNMGIAKTLDFYYT